jgi:hypothetical protein
MSTSILKNKNVFLLISMFFSIISIAQTNMVGRWEVKQAIGLRDVDEYSLVEQKKRDYGHALILNQDGTFYNEDVVECLSGSSVLPSGTYALIDNYHIRFIVEDVDFQGFTSGMIQIKKSDLIRDLGIFYIYKDSKSVRLIKSNGVLQDDKDKMLYTEMLNTFDKNWKSYDYAWQSTKANTPEEIISNFVDNRKLVDLSNGKILYSKKEDYGQLFLVQGKDNFHFVLYDEFKKKVSLAYFRLIE